MVLDEQPPGLDRLSVLAGGAMVVALGPWLGASATPMIAGIAFAASVTLVLTLLVPRKS